MPVFTDQMNRTIRLEGTPGRIISLVPSQTELLFDLDLEEEVMAITQFCIHPASWQRNKTKIGGTKKLNLEKIRALQPDLLIGNKEENDQAQLEILMQSFPVWMSDIVTLNDSLDMIDKVGELTDRSVRAAELIDSIESEFATLSPVPPSRKAAYFIWNKPWMAAGKETFINDMMEKCGWKNAFPEERYPAITPELLKQADPEIILLSSEPFPFTEKHFGQFLSVCPHAQIKLVDGEMFSWYGSRLIHAPAYFRRLLLMK